MLEVFSASASLLLLAWGLPFAGAYGRLPLPRQALSAQGRRASLGAVARPVIGRCQGRR